MTREFLFFLYFFFAFVIVIVVSSGNGTNHAVQNHCARELVGLSRHLTRCTARWWRGKRCKMCGISFRSSVGRSEHRYLPIRPRIIEWLPTWRESYKLVIKIYFIYTLLWQGIARTRTRTEMPSTWHGL